MGKSGEEGKSEDWRGGRRRRGRRRSYAAMTEESEGISGKELANLLNWRRVVVFLLKENAVRELKQR